MNDDGSMLVKAAAATGSEGRGLGAARYAAATADAKSSNPHTHLVSRGFLPGRLSDACTGTKTSRRWPASRNPSHFQTFPCDAAKVASRTRCEHPTNGSGYLPLA